MVHSLAMRVEEIEGRWFIEAPWLDEPVEGASFKEAYDEALRLRVSISR